MSLKVETIATGQMGANCYLLYSSSSSECIIIDPGDDAMYIVQYIRDLELKPTRIIATHGHFDHVMAALELQLTFNIPFSIHSKDAFLLKNMSNSAKHFLNIESGPPPKIDSHLSPDSDIKIGSHLISIIETPGHTPGSISLYLKDSKIIFVGDVIFAAGAIGRYDFSYSDSIELTKSIKTILSLPGQTTIYPGHGSKTSVENEKKYHSK